MSSTQTIAPSKRRIMSGMSNAQKHPDGSAVERTMALLGSRQRVPKAALRAGYLDLLGEQDPTGAHPGQRLMLSRTLPLIYERAWRPIGARALMGVRGPGPRQEQRMALQMLQLRGEDLVLDLACGPGNFTRSFAKAAKPGLVVGLDASASMLELAVRETEAENVAYVRGDACELPFPDACFDAVCCFAALYLIDRPLAAIDEVARVLAPGGRVALLTSCNRGPLPAGLSDAVVRRLTGVRIFARDELRDALAARGLVDIDQRVMGLAQFVSARRPAGKGNTGKGSS
jgi:ubiquinone/menaquinone biosynthesis C-methylase UbiE